ncbi:MAG: sel1 repeat family protein [Myxococcales bacterium]|nr:sel1 repeat family protein [Myxococcales bacterium]MBK7192900.1 sel1 repeat family protein [Myxococcales bacterium]MBP6845500.1 sel1 repeat family protein [Kofleriaceae bacterium]
MPRSLAAWVVALLPLAACPGPRAAPSCPPVAPTGPTAPLAPTDPTAAARAACAAGDLAGCDDLVEHWGQRELGPAAPADAEVLRVACDDRAIAAACMGHAVMRKYGTATGVRDPDGAAPYFARLVELGDIQGYRGKPPSAEGQAALAATERACATGRRRACAQLGWAAFSAVQQPKDVRVAFARWHQACGLGVTSACRWAGHVAYTYDEVKDLAAAAKLLERARDTPGGEDELGEFLTATGAAPRARDHYLAGCALGSRSACWHAGAALVAAACVAGEDAACAAAPPPPH